MAQDLAAFYALKGLLNSLSARDAGSQSQNQSKISLKQQKFLTLTCTAIRIQVLRFFEVNQQIVDLYMNSILRQKE